MLAAEGNKVLTVGILGGMGPLATVDLFEKIVRCTPARSDQEHLKIIVYNNPQIPSRVAAIMDGAKSPAAALVEAARLLERWGAELIAMPCNTAHYWFEDVRQAVGVGLINMIENAAEYAAANMPGETAMLLATEATVRTGLYQRAFAARGLALDVPGPREQATVTRAIEAVKAGELDGACLRAVDGVIAGCQRCGAEAFVAGCTEMPIVFRHVGRRFRQVDPTLLLAQAVVRQAMEREPGGA